MKINTNNIPDRKDPIVSYDGPDQNYKSILEGLPVAVYTCDKEGYITFFNKHAAKLWGRQPQLGRDLWCGSWKIFTPEGVPLPLASCPMALVLKKGAEVEQQEILIEKPDGTRINVIPQPKPLFDSSGNLIGAVNMLIDITRSKTDQQNAARLASIVESSVAAIVGKTLEGIVTSWNVAAQKIFGYTPEEMIGQPIIKLIPHDCYDEEASILSRLSKGEKIEQMETRRITKEGRLIDISLTVSPIKDDNGKIIGISKIARDVTKIKESERLIKESVERFRMAVEATMLGTWEYDPLSQDLEWSRETKRIYGYPEDEYVDFGVFLKHIHPEDLKYVQNEIEKVLSSPENGNYDTQFRIIRLDGNTRWVRAQGKVYFNNLNIAERFIGTILDITDDKNAKEELEKLVSERTKALRMMNKQLQRSNADLEQFASVASHDLQEPLRKIQMYCDRILENPTDKNVYEKYFPNVISSASRMSQLIKDVLHYAQISDGFDNFSKVDLNAILDNVCSDFEVAMKEKDATISADRLPVITGNATQLQQLFSNLISNSIKFSMVKPFIHITSRVVTQAEIQPDNKNNNESALYVELKFRDNGIGFEQKYAEQVFEIFQRLQDRRTFTGTGIGLAVCKKIVENHHGMISVTSEPGEGTTFSVILPME